MSGAERPRLIRRLAFELLFQLDAMGAVEVDEAQWSLTMGSSDTAEELNEGGRARAEKMAREAWGHRRAIDDLITQVSAKWPAHRMPATDRALVRLGIYEMRWGRVSAAIAINEAVELAREFGTEKSAGFVNSVLDDVKGLGEEEVGEEGLGEEL